MAEQSNIEWTRSTFNPWWGCTKISPGCDHCYAERDAHRFGTPWGAGQPRRLFGNDHWDKPRLWNAKAAKEQASNPAAQWRVFCASMGDVFDNEVSSEHRDRLWALIRETPNLTWLVLTKRIGNVATMLPADWGGGYPNVWLGISVGNQEEADRDIPKLLNTPARLRWLSMEPLLGPVRLDNPTPRPSRYDQNGRGIEWIEEATWLWRPDGIDWVVVGGESGPHARPMHPEWARSLRDQCADAGVPFMFKQWGEWLPWSQYHNGVNDPDPEQTRLRTMEFEDGKWNDVGFPSWCDDVDEEQCAGRVGKKAAGRLLDGCLHDAYPPIR